MFITVVRLPCLAHTHVFKIDRWIVTKTHTAGKKLKGKDAVIPLTVL